MLGAGQGGLSAAIHARLKGYDVLVLEQRDVAGGKAAQIEQDGFLLDPGPSIIILPALYESVFKAAGRSMADYLRFIPLNPFSRVFYGSRDNLIDLPAGYNHCIETLRQAAPEDVEAFKTMFGKLAKIAPLIDKTIFAYPFDKPHQLLNPNLIRTALPFDVRKTFKELVDASFKSPLLRAFFYGFPSYGGQTYDSKAAGALLIPYYMIAQGVYYPEGGVGAIPRAFERLARELGVEFRFEAKIAKLHADGSAIRTIELESGERIDADQVISNVDFLTTRSWLGHRVDWEPSLSYFTVHWGLKRRLPGLEHHTLLIPKGFEPGFEQLYRQKRFPGEPIVYLNATAALEPNAAPEGGENLFAVITAPAQETHLDWKAESEGHVATTRRILSDFGFDWTPEEEVFQRVQTPDLFAARDGNYRGSLYGPHERHRLWGILPQPNRDREYRNLLYCGGSVQPGAGLPMVTLSGKFAAMALP